MNGHYRKEFTDTVTHVQKLSVSIAVVTVRDMRGSLDPQSMIGGYKVVIRRMIDRIREDVTVLPRDSDRYRLKRMQLALYILLNQVLNIQSRIKYTEI